MSISLSCEFNKFVCAQSQDAIMKSFEIARAAGVKIFLIGGIVRDLILNNPIKDIDIAVQGDAIEFAHELSNFGLEILNIQENLRTVKVKFPNSVIIDFASTRQEKYSASGMLPAAYNFGCELEKDVLRRDFTINTLALDDNLLLIDYMCGYEDIQNKKIRILHEKSFIDDPSRIIRALKFKERFNFELEQNTYELMKDYLNNINYDMPLERIKNELRQYFEIDKKGLYSRFIESSAYKLISDNPIKEIDEKRFKNVFGKEKNRWFIYIVFLIVNSAFPIERLNLTAFERKVVKEVHELCFSEIPKTKIDIYNLLNDLSELSIGAYYVLSANPSVKKFLEAFKDIKVLITGKDLINLGFIPSPYFSELFELILKEKLDGHLTTKEQEINFVKQFLKKGE